MTIKFTRFLSEDIDILVEKGGLFSEVAVKQIQAEILEQDPELAALITFGEPDFTASALDDIYTISATLSEKVPLERIQKIFDNGVAGLFDIV
jgi:hypothetical protein